MSIPRGSAAEYNYGLSVWTCRMIGRPLWKEHMFSLAHGNLDLRWQRREFLRYGAGLAAMGGLLPAGLIGEAAEVQPAASGKSCIFIYLLGGPPHLDMFDLKPDAPAE